MRYMGYGLSQRHRGTEKRHREIFIMFEKSFSYIIHCELRIINIRPNIFKINSLYDRYSTYQPSSLNIYANY